MCGAYMTSGATPRGGRQFWVTLVVAGVIGLLLSLNWVVGAPSSAASYIRLQPPLLGSIVNVVAPLVLIALIPIVLFRGPRKGRRWLLIPLVPLAAWASFVAMISSFDLLDVASQGYSNGLEPLEQVELTSSRATLYRTNGGATTSFGILLREEKRLAPGVWLVNHVRNWYPAREGALEVLGSDSLLVRVQGAEHVLHFGSGRQGSQ